MVDMKSIIYNMDMVATCVLANMFRLALENVQRPEPRPGETAFPPERRYGRLQLDDDNLYAEMIPNPPVNTLHRSLQ